MIWPRSHSSQMAMMWQWCGMEEWGAILPVPRAAVPCWEMPSGYWDQGLRKREEEEVVWFRWRVKRLMGPPLSTRVAEPCPRRSGGHLDHIWASSPPPTSPPRPAS